MEVQLLDDLCIQILRGFDLKATTINKLKSYYICNTNQGVKIIKKVNDSVESILLQHEIKTHLINNGFNNIDSFYLSKQNKPYYNYNNNLYIVSNIAINETFDIRNKDLYLNMIKTISKMHVYFKNTKFNNYNIPLGTDLTIELNKSLKNLKLIKKRIHNKTRLSDFDVIFIKNYKTYINDITQSLFYLKELNYAEYRNKALIERSMCHNLLKKENILLNQGELFITNFSACTIDTSLLDLSSVLKKYIINIEEDPLNIEQIINSYCKYNSLCDNEIKLLYVLLMYPSKFIKTCNLYYFKQRKWASTSMVNRLQNIVDYKKHFNNYISFIKI